MTKAPLNYLDAFHHQQNPHQLAKSLALFVLLVCNRYPLDLDTSATLQQSMRVIFITQTGDLPL